MIDADKLIEQLQSEDQETKDSAIKQVRSLSVTDRNELFSAAKKHGGVSTLFTYLTGNKAPVAAEPVQRKAPKQKSVLKGGIGHINQKWNKKLVPIDPSSDNLYGKDISVGVVIGTFAAVPYIHLQLEARKRLYPDVPLLVHDDGSKQGKQLEQLCNQYDCDFEYNSERQPHCLGDLSAFVGGLKWADEKKLDILVKISRRWIWLVNWIPDLINLAHKSQYATFSNLTITFGFGFRTECIGMSTKSWAISNFYREFCGLIKDRKYVFVEGHIHKLARDIEKQNCYIANIWMNEHPMKKDSGGYAQWDLMGNDRVTTSKDKRIWHDSHSPLDYANLANKWSLPYKEEDFLDPNQGQGIGNKP